MQLFYKAASYSGEAVRVAAAQYTLKRHFRKTISDYWHF